MPPLTLREQQVLQLMVTSENEIGIIRGISGALPAGGSRSSV
jgi:DNA-binding CsgD family transcriptional regulator